MKYVFLTFFLISITSCNSKFKRELQGKSEFQKQMNAKFKDASQSPLTKKDLKKFKGLDFFPLDTTYIVIANFVKTSNTVTLEFPTTTNSVVLYKQYGILKFKIKEKDYSLVIYKNQYPEITFEEHLFLPFFDKTNGKQTYKGGRFINVLTSDINKDDFLEIDFNKAYNPYCAYNKKFSCPIAPKSNYINTEILAGVKAYEK